MHLTTIQRRDLQRMLRQEERYKADPSNVIPGIRLRTGRGLAKLGLAYHANAGSANRYVSWRLTPNGLAAAEALRHHDEMAGGKDHTGCDI